MSESTYTRVAIVTGASQGIGQGIALRLADDGLDVAINDIGLKREAVDKVVAEIQAKGRRAIAVLADVSSEDEVKRTVEETVQKLGRLDVMIANAGVVHGGVGSPSATVSELSLQNWKNMMAVDVEGVMLCYKYASLQMIKQGQGGRIIGASSVCGKRGFATLGPYCAAKFAVRGLTQCAALELAEHNITVNAYAPGVIDTPFIHGLSDGIQQVKEGLGISHAKTGYPDDIAHLVSYLVSPQAHYITGQAVSIDGGLRMD
ncbi:hypothetical protein EVG20_g2130 [Dentipellis fragilis]|uniref:Uncharacterized protein n=1 Tax=Dentipellis fragilis TaxID=205917 RepID=A0A4Y9ZAM9_9AGAM|nr:hypothetical protein EVG20_g2130 [Dentipellis fragilis]